MLFQKKSTPKKWATVSDYPGSFQQTELNLTENAAVIQMLLRSTDWPYYYTTSLFDQYILICPTSMIEQVLTIANHYVKTGGNIPAVCGSVVKALYHQTHGHGFDPRWYATAFTDFVPFSKVLKLDCLFSTQGCAEVFILQWIDTAWNFFIYWS